MKHFEMARPTDLKEASSLLGKDLGEARLLAGGMDLLGELKDHIIEPNRLVNLKSVRNLDYIDPKGGNLRLGALVTLTEIAGHADIRKRYTALAEAAEVVGSPQIRNIGTLGGNLCQRPRCWYYRDEHVHCLKKGGNHCFAVNGQNQYHAILGGGPCFIVHPSDLAPALIALDAQVKIVSAAGSRDVPLEKFFILPAEDPHRENILQPGEIVSEVSVPEPEAGVKSAYLKQREKESFDWSLSACAAALEMDGRACRNARLVLGGVAPAPWRAAEAEKALQGKTIDEAAALQAAEAAVRDATSLEHNGYKVPLTKAVVQMAILKAAGA
ncbi:MAG: xanthine dehydrogenase family protein subunit M [Armatimonadetes bacterium]|nr:xanthine dehydrogenase family protein subunit M [Armatimonadota bacterium]